MVGEGVGTQSGKEAAPPAALVFHHDMQSLAPADAVLRARDASAEASSEADAILRARDTSAVDWESQTSSWERFAASRLNPRPTVVAPQRQPPGVLVEARAHAPSHDDDHREAAEAEQDGFAQDSTAAADLGGVDVDAALSAIDSLYPQALGEPPHWLYYDDTEASTLPPQTALQVQQVQQWRQHTMLQMAQILDIEAEMGVPFAESCLQELISEWRSGTPGIVGGSSGPPAVVGQPEFPLLALFAEHPPPWQMETPAPRRRRNV